MNDALFDCDRIAAAGAAFGQAATRPEWGGVVVSSARFVEFSTRATVVHVPDLVRLDLTPGHDGMQVHFRGLRGAEVSWRGGRPDGVGGGRAHEFRGLIAHPDARLAFRARVVILVDAEAGGSHLAARMAIGPA